MKASFISTSGCPKLIRYSGHGSKDKKALAAVFDIKNGGEFPVRPFRNKKGKFKAFQDSEPWYSFISWLLYDIFYIFFVFRASMSAMKMLVLSFALCFTLATLPFVLLHNLMIILTLLLSALLSEIRFMVALGRCRNKRATLRQTF